MTRADTKKLVAWDRKYVWHPFTQMKEWGTRLAPAVVIDKAKGNYLIDTDGKRYLDGVSSLWCNVHGHRVKEIDDAVKRQLKKVSHSTFLGLTHSPAILLAKKLVSLAPKGLARVFYSDSGSAAVEVALKMSYQYWRLKGEKKRRTFLSLKNAYHGDTIGSVSVGGIDLFHEIFKPLLFETFSADFSAGKVGSVLKAHAGRICAIVMEPLMQGAAGMLKAPKGYLSGVAGLAKRHGVHLIVDEVATGFGRTGTMFACGHEGVRPDFLCLGKGITGGYLPLSATLTTEEVYRAFLGEYGELKAFFHGHTYSANPLACAAALANLEIFEKEKTIRRLQPKIRLLAQALEEIRGLAHVGDVRQTGLMVGIELVKDRATQEPYPMGEKRGHRVTFLARRYGVMLRPLGNVVVLMPPLSITGGEIRKLCRVAGRCIREATES